MPTRNTTDYITFCELLKGILIGLLGAGMAVAMAIPISIALEPTTTTTTTTEMTTTSTSSVITTVLITNATTTTITTTITTTNSRSSCIFPCTCAGISPYTLWQPYSTYNGMYMTINTTNCYFNQTPLYFTSTAGISSHSGLSGIGSIYGPSSTSFTVYVLSLVGWNTSTLMNLATNNTWNVNWYGLYY